MINFGLLEILNLLFDIFLFVFFFYTFELRNNSCIFYLKDGF